MPGRPAGKGPSKPLLSELPQGPGRRGAARIWSRIPFLKEEKTHSDVRECRRCGWRREAEGTYRENWGTLGHLEASGGLWEQWKEK